MSARLDDVTDGLVDRAGPVERWWFAPVPSRRIEICGRITFGYAAVWLVVRGPYVWAVAGLPARRYEPVGVLSLFPGSPGRPLVIVVWLLALAGCGAVLAGRTRRLGATVGSIGVLVIATLTSSFGQVFHTEHLLVLHLLILAAATFEASSGDSPRRSGWPLSLMMSTVVVAYVLAGVAKLRFGGAEWLSGEVLRIWVAADNLRKVLLDDPASSIGGWLAGVAWIWAPIAVMTLVIEIGAPMALVPGRIRLAWIAAAWLFHVGVVVLMAIVFPYQLSGVAYLAFLRVERVEARFRSVPRFRRSPAPSH